MKIYRCLIAHINTIIEAQGSFHIDINNDNRKITECIKIDDYMIDIKSGDYYPILETDFTFEIDETLVNEINFLDSYVVRFEESNLDKDPRKWYYEEKAKTLYKKYDLKCRMR